MNKFFLILMFLLSLIVNVNSQERGYLNDNDGYTNIREQKTVNSAILERIEIGNEFVYYSDSKSDWWKVYYKDIEGYIHKSRVVNFFDIEDKIKERLNNQNDVKIIDSLISLYPAAFVSAFCLLNDKIQDTIFKNVLCERLKTPDFYFIYEQILQSTSNCIKVEKLQESIRIAALNNNIDILDSIPLPEMSFSERDKRRLFDKQVDSINNRPIDYYLNNVEVSVYAKLYYLGKSVPTDINNSLNFIDGINSTTDDLRPFYIYLFNSIILASDGAMSDITASTCREFLENKPCEFIKLKNNPLVKPNFQEWLEMAASGYYYEVSHEVAVNKSFNSILHNVELNCPDLKLEIENMKSIILEKLSNYWL